MVRISREDLYMGMAELVALRSTCQRAQVGAVIVKNNRVVSMGYGGAPARLPHCTQVGCQIGPDGGCMRTIHAEANALIFAAKEGIAVDEAQIYCTHSPCLNCAKLIVNSGIRQVIYRIPYRDPRGLDLIDDAGLEIIYFQTGGFN